MKSDTMVQRTCIIDGTVYNDDPKYRTIYDGSDNESDRNKCPICNLRKKMEESIDDLRDEILERGEYSENY